MWIIPRNDKLVNEARFVPYEISEQSEALARHGVWHRQKNKPPYGHTAQYWKIFLQYGHSGGAWVDNVRGRLCSNNKEFTETLVHNLKREKGRGTRTANLFSSFRVNPPQQIRFRHLTNAQWAVWSSENITARYSNAVRNLKRQTPCHIAFFFQTDSHGDRIDWSEEVMLSSALRFHRSYRNTLISIDLEPSSPCATLDEDLSLEDVVARFVEGKKAWKTPLAAGDLAVGKDTQAYQSILEGEDLSYSATGPLVQMLAAKGEDLHNYYLNPRFLEVLMGLPVNTTRPSASSLGVTLVVEEPCEDFTQSVKDFFAIYNINFGD